MPSKTTPFFSPGPASKEYAFNRDDESRQDVRDYCEALWQRYASYNGDPHFLSDAKQNFHSRTWEMILTCALLDEGMLLGRPPSDGPDIKIETDPPTWIEAVTVHLGTGLDHAGRLEYWREADVAMFHPQEEKTILRYTSAITTKTQQRREFERRGVVASRDRYVVALNGALLDDYSSGDSDPYILKSVYPIGEFFVSIALHKSQPPEYGYHPRGHVTKASGAKIPTTAFLNAEFSGVSGLLYSRTRAWHPQPMSRDYMLFIHNKVAAAPVPPGLFGFGREAVIDGDQVKWVQHPSVRKRASISTGASGE